MISYSYEQVHASLYVSTSIPNVPRTSTATTKSTGTPAARYLQKALLVLVRQRYVHSQQYTAVSGLYRTPTCDKTPTPTAVRVEPAAHVQSYR